MLVIKRSAGVAQEVSPRILQVKGPQARDPSWRGNPGQTLSPKQGISTQQKDLHSPKMNKEDDRNWSFINANMFI